ncbi:MAG: MaoC family dehydratase [Betaproteobacteria bacterium]|nr:MaoC family dehydratase [Betaproteobacteria bacterium]MBL8532632.1 MaoC family dehydratase [Betaproteobacteria bacterium]
MPRIRIERLEDLEARVGEELVVSDWLDVTQERIDLFAEATGDHQWIHVDVERATRESPFGGPIAHGYLTLSLLAKFAFDSFEFASSRMGVNYGLNRVRFTQPVPAGSRIRAHFTLARFERVQGGVQLVFAVTMEREGSDKPVMVAETVSRRYD